jgi:hypothetical protein
MKELISAVEQEIETAAKTLMDWGQEAIRFTSVR